VIATLRRPSERRTPQRRGSRRPWLRWVWRGFLVAGGLLIAYLVVTFVQVWLASNRSSAPASDAIVVLGAAQYDCTPSPVLERRLSHALQLYESNVAGRIFVTGGKQEGDRCTEATAGAEWLLAEGVPDANILRENQGASSWESLAAAARILREQDMTRVVLVTDGYHALRVEAIADDLGLDAAVSPSATTPRRPRRSRSAASSGSTGWSTSTTRSRTSWTRRSRRRRRPKTTCDRATPAGRVSLRHSGVV
jgi:uncharacterized SAM-binding protein YcdF (DUF218 family)